MSISSGDIVVPVGPRLDKPLFGVRTPGDSDRVEEGDFARALNPLHYIPGVSQVYEEATGNKGSAAMKIIGAAVLGGPLGLIAGVANAIFEQETGKSVVGAVASLFTGEEPTTQLASAKAAPVAEVAQAEVTSAPQSFAANSPITPKAMQLASAASAGPLPMSADDQRDAQVLALFGGQVPSAHKSYQKAQMLPYLEDVTQSQVI